MTKESKIGKCIVKWQKLGKIWEKSFYKLLWTCDNFVPQFWTRKFFCRKDSKQIIKLMVARRALKFGQFEHRAMGSWVQTRAQNPVHENLLSETLFILDGSSRFRHRMLKALRAKIWHGKMTQKLSDILEISNKRQKSSLESFKLHKFLIVRMFTKVWWCLPMSGKYSSTILYPNNYGCLMGFWNFACLNTKQGVLGSNTRTKKIWHEMTQNTNRLLLVAFRALKILNKWPNPRALQMF